MKYKNTNPFSHKIIKVNENTHYYMSVTVLEYTLCMQYTLCKDLGANQCNQ